MKMMMHLKLEWMDCLVRLMLFVDTDAPGSNDRPEKASICLVVAVLPSIHSLVCSKQVIRKPTTLASNH